MTLLQLLQYSLSNYSDDHLETFFKFYCIIHIHEGNMMQYIMILLDKAKIQQSLYSIIAGTELK